MKVQQFVMAYKVEQDRIRAMLPEGYESLRPVLRINVEIVSREDTLESPQEIDLNQTLYIEFNTPVEASGRRGWLNIANWKSTKTEISYTKKGSAVTFNCPFLEITYTGVGIQGGCPAEKDNDGCFFLSADFAEFRHTETIDEKKEFCDCEFAWKFAEGNAKGISIGGKSIPAVPTAPQRIYAKQALTAENAADIECQQILGAYSVIFDRQIEY